MSEATFTFRVDEALKSEFAQAARIRDRTAAQLLRDYMREFVHQQQVLKDHDVWFHCEVQAGTEAAEAGQVVSAEEVEAESATWREGIRRSLATSKS